MRGFRPFQDPRGTVRGTVAHPDNDGGRVAETLSSPWVHGRCCSRSKSEDARLPLASKSRRGLLTGVEEGVPKAVFRAQALDARRVGLKAVSIRELREVRRFEVR